MRTFLSRDMALEQEKMSVTIQVDLPEEIIREARQLGLLDSERMTAMLAEELRRRRAGLELKRALDQVRSAPGEAMSKDEISGEIEMARKERRGREAGA
jgi:hypothetical protein